MTQRNGPTPFYATRGYRMASGAFGAVLLGIGSYALVAAAPLDALQLLGCAAVLAAGGNLAWCACTGRESWLSKIGPLP